MNKNDLASAMAEDAGITKSSAIKALDAMTNAIKSALRAGDKVSIPGFGTFQAKHRSARMGRNPATGESIQIAASNSPSFKAGKALKDALN
ncbi:MAG: HU family DNA-binding protein [Gammaproteobacteria bacterium]|nr:HU family DNA-binding protein [Gammaproteobacteria bacterium]